MNTTALITTTDANNMQALEIWHDATPDSTVELVTVLTQKVVTDDVIQTVTTEAVGSGVIDYICLWYPLTNESSVAAT